jgi:hypothetical protein
MNKAKACRDPLFFPLAVCNALHDKQEQIKNTSVGGLLLSTSLRIGKKIFVQKLRPIISTYNTISVSMRTGTPDPRCHLADAGEGELANGWGEVRIVCWEPSLFLFFILFVCFNSNKRMTSTRL